MFKGSIGGELEFLLEEEKLSNVLVLVFVNK